jgi:mono/diheme cytochrome c family protein
MRVQLSSILLTLIALAFGGTAVGVVVLYAGFYNVAATHQHLRPTYWLLKIGLRESIERHSRTIAVPPLTDPALAHRGLELYREHCLQCHGAPGVAPEPFALGLTPLPTNLADAAREFSDAQLYWVVKNGIKMTAMPAWEFRFSDDEIWSVVAFMRELPLISPEQYAARSELPAVAVAARTQHADRTPGAGDAVRGKMALRQYGCTTCHRIPDVVGDNAPVGPPLDRIATREYLAGVIPNTPQNMVRWLRAPQEIAPLSAMPDLGVTERDAIDMAAYLYKLR